MTNPTLSSGDKKAKLQDVRFGGYSIQHHLGKGGMGDVYRAKQIGLDRIVALKVLPQSLARSGEFSERFYAEAYAISRLQHQNIVTIYDYGEENDQKFIAMQFVEGRTLSEIIREHGPFEYERIIEIAKQICRGLKYAHQHGIVHRDIKSGNIMVASGDRIFITDFGIAQVADATRITTTGMTMGTPEYMSPEQCEGGVIDSQSDLYALGILLYEMAIGKPPFLAETPLAVAYKQVNDQAPLLKKIRPELPVRLELIVAKCLKKKKPERYKSADELLRDLDSVDPQPFIPPPPTTKDGIPEQRITDRREKGRRRRDKEETTWFKYIVVSLITVAMVISSFMMGWVTKNSGPSPWLKPLSMQSSFPESGQIVGSPAMLFDGDQQRAWIFPSSLSDTSFVSVDFKQPVVLQGLVVQLGTASDIRSRNFFPSRLSMVVDGKLAGNFNLQATREKQFISLPGIWGSRISFTFRPSDSANQPLLAIREIAFLGAKYGD